MNSKQRSATLTRRGFLQASTAGLAAGVVASSSRHARGAISELAKVDVTLVDKEAVGYATFQNHNQKVLQNAGGIFMTHIRSRNEAYTAQQWRLSHSTDGGRTFSTVYEATHATNPPAIETDAEANVYLVRPDFADGYSYLYRFAAPDYGQPEVIAKIPGGACGKFCLLLDADREQFYFFSNNNTFHVLGLDGQIKHSLTLTRGGQFGGIQYPHLYLAPDGMLHAPITTEKTGRYCYRSVQHLQSPDGGQTWQRMDSTTLAPAVVCDDSGPTQRISLDDEFEAHSWLCSCVARGGKVHFVYSTLDSHSKDFKSPLIRMNYVRCDAATGEKDFHRQELNGQTITLDKWNGFLATRRRQPEAPLYAMMADDERLACLVSHDNGTSWQDHVLGETEYTDAYSIGGSREITDDGYLIGSFTDRVQSSLDPEGVCPVYFFRVKAAPVGE